jgi:superfamily II DNA or RNA helicase
MNAAGGGIEPTTTFLNSKRLSRVGPQGFLLAIERLLWYLNFEDVRNIDGRGDEGGDLLGLRGGYRWVFQCKWKKTGLVGEDAVREVDAAKAFYQTDRAVVATNRAPGRKAAQRREKLLGVGVRIDFWADEALAKFADGIIPDYVPSRYELRPYQTSAIKEVKRSIDSTGKALVIMATGLGKTVVVGEVVDWWLKEHPREDVLVVAHVKEIVRQLERAMWRHVPKWISTQALTGDEQPSDLDGVTCATVQSAIKAVETGWRPGLVVVDEAHHAGEGGYFQRLLDMLTDSPVLGVTATPWRGDEYDISTHFGKPVFRMGIAEGMAKGFLAEVDYRLFVDELDWSAVSDASKRDLTIKELNRRLFLPQRDEAVVDRLREAWQDTIEPRAIVYCRTINHAEEVAQFLREAGWRRASCINTKLSRRDRDLMMSEFRDGRIPILTAVDIFNEGVDVPDVNILCFLRVTHSRRIFVQQLGRGLRLASGKEHVRVLDFISDVRRVAATLDLQRSLDRLRDEEIERVKLAQPMIQFSEPNIGSLMQEWLRDAAAIEDADDEVRLEFPDLPDHGQ